MNVYKGLSYITFYKGSLVFNSTGTDRSSGVPQFYRTDPIYNLETGKTIKWTTPEILKFSGTANVISISYDPNTSTNYISMPSKDQMGVVGISVYKNDKNGNPLKTTPLAINSKYKQIYNPTLSSDGKVMIFVMNIGKGSNLFICKKISETQWSDPKLLSNNINTPYNQNYPLIYRDSILFFSSNGLMGLGGYDIFYSIISVDGGRTLTGNVDLSKVKFSDPVNMLYPINSGADDFSLIMKGNGNGGFLISTRDTAVGIPSIYSFDREPQVFEITGNYLVPRLYANNLMPSTSDNIVPIRDTVYIDRYTNNVTTQQQNIVSENIVKEQEKIDQQQRQEQAKRKKDQDKEMKIIREDALKQADKASKIAAQNANQPKSKVTIDDNESSDHLEYRVQVAASRQPLDIKTMLPNLFYYMPNLVIEETYGNDGYYRYHTKNLGTFEAADALRKEIKALGIQCFISTYKNNSRIKIDIK